MDFDIRSVLFDLGVVPGVSGFEQPAAERAALYLRKYCRDVYTTPLHNLIGLRPCGQEGAPRLLLDAHLDQIGFVVSDITEDGFLRFVSRGGFDPRVLMGKEVVVLADTHIPGIIACMPPHLQSAEEADKTVVLTDMVIDTGLTPDNVRAHISVGTPIMTKNSVFRLQNGFFGAAGLDDRISFVAILYALELLGDKRPPVDIVVLGSSNEEVGAWGALTGTYDAYPDYAIAIDVGHALTPDAPKNEAVSAGSGAAISMGPHLHAGVTRRLIERAKAASIPYTLNVEEGFTGTNASTIQLVRFGVATGLLGIPLRYMHTPVEVVKTEDVEAIGRLLYEFIMSFEGGEPV